MLCVKIFFIFGSATTYPLRQHVQQHKYNSLNKSSLHANISIKLAKMLKQTQFSHANRRIMTVFCKLASIKYIVVYLNRIRGLYSSLEEILYFFIEFICRLAIKSISRYFHLRENSKTQFHNILTTRVIARAAFVVHFLLGLIFMNTMILFR